MGIAAIGWHDRLDLLQLHDLRTQNDLNCIFGPAGALEALLAAREQGRVRFLGISGHHDPAILLEAMRRFDFDTVLVALNAADLHRLSFIKTVLPQAVRRGMGVIAMKVYAAGQLVQRRRLAGLLRPAGLTAEQALGYVLSLDGVNAAIIGCQTPEEVTENTRIARDFERLDDGAMRRPRRGNPSWCARLDGVQASCGMSDAGNYVAARV